MGSTILNITDDDGKENTEFLKSQITSTGLPMAVEGALNYSNDGYEEWFLPSNQELSLVAKNLSSSQLNQISMDESDSFSISGFWSSCTNDTKKAMMVDLEEGVKARTLNYKKAKFFFVLPVRAF